MKPPKTIEWTERQKDYIRQLVLEELDRALALPYLGKGVPAWLNIFYLLRLFNSGAFTGNLSVRVVGHTIYPFRITEQELHLEELFKEELDQLETL